MKSNSWRECKDSARRASAALEALIICRCSRSPRSTCWITLEFARVNVENDFKFLVNSKRKLANRTRMSWTYLQEEFNIFNMAIFRAQKVCASMRMLFISYAFSDMTMLLRRYRSQSPKPRRHWMRCGSETRSSGLTSSGKRTITPISSWTWCWCLSLVDVMAMSLRFTTACLRDS